MCNIPYLSQFYCQNRAVSGFQRGRVFLSEMLRPH